MTRVNFQQGELNFLSTFTTFGRPQDVTVTSLRIEHLIPADPHTRHTLRRAYEQASQSRVPPLANQHGRTGCHHDRGGTAKQSLLRAQARQQVTNTHRTKNKQCPDTQ